MFVERKEKVTHINSDKVIGLKIRATLSTNQMQSAFVTRVFPPFRWVFIVSFPDKKFSNGFQVSDYRKYKFISVQQSQGWQTQLPVVPVTRIFWPWRISKSRSRKNSQ